MIKLGIKISIRLKAESVDPYGMNLRMSNFLHIDQATHSCLWFHCVVVAVQ